MKRSIRITAISLAVIALAWSGWHWTFAAVAETARVPGGIPATTLYATFDQWKAACSRLPSNRALQGRYPPKNLLPLPKFSDFDEALSAFLDSSKAGFLKQATNWVGETPGPGFFNTATAYFLRPVPPNPAIKFQPFAQKLTLPPDSEVFVRGDLHGDVHSFLADLAWLNQSNYLRSFAITRTNFYMLFLGDYTDRGNYGIEVLYTLYRLKVANPDRVFLARGNHEELSLQTRYGFFEEARAKYGADFNAAKVVRAYDFLPVVIYLGSGTNFIQCNHGGMEPGYHPGGLLASEGPIRFQFLGTLSQQKFLSENPQWFGHDTTSKDQAARSLKNFRPDDPISPTVLGFMWNDFSIVPGESQFAVDPGRAFVYGDKATGYLLQKASNETNKVRAVFRAHQHSSVPNAMMRRLIASHGVFRHWQSTDSLALANAPISELARQIEQGKSRAIPPGSVWTFNVSPDTPYGEGCNFSFDTFGLLTVAPAFDEWRLKPVNLPIKP